MLYVLTTRNADKTIATATALAFDKLTDEQRRTAESRWDWKTFDAAKEVAAALGEGYVATNSPHVRPQFDVVALPKVGDKISYAFNGDYYPCGEVASISKSLKVVVSTEGQKFYRVRESGAWRYNRTWSLVAGHVSKLNPEF